MNTVYQGAFPMLWWRWGRHEEVACLSVNCLLTSRTVAIKPFSRLNIPTYPHKHFSYIWNCWANSTLPLLFLFLDLSSLVIYLSSARSCTKCCLNRNVTLPHLLFPFSCLPHCELSISKLKLTMLPFLLRVIASSVSSLILYQQDPSLYCFIQTSIDFTGDWEKNKTFYLLIHLKQSILNSSLFKELRILVVCWLCFTFSVIVLLPIY